MANAIDTILTSLFYLHTFWDAVKSSVIVLSDYVISFIQQCWMRCRTLYTKQVSVIEFFYLFIKFLSKKYKTKLCDCVVCHRSHKKEEIF